MNNDRFDLSLVLPCLNEERTLKECLQEARRISSENSLTVELIVADNGSTDTSLEIANRYADVVVNVDKRGYGAALDGGIKTAKSEFVLVADSDLSYDFSKLPDFLRKLREEGYDLVLGNRFKGKIMPGAMPWHHKYIGNPVLSFIGRVIFTSEIGDFHCGIRAFRKTSYLNCQIASSGMEYASEMIIQFASRGMRITEIPVKLSKDGRDRKPHLRSFRDGLRHLKLMLSLAPQFTLLLPGFLMASVSNILLFLSYLNQKNVINTTTSMVYLVSIGVFGSSLFGLGAISIALRKIEGAGKFKWLPISYSKIRESVTVFIPIFAMVFGQILLLAQNSQTIKIIGISISISGAILLSSALVVRQILRKHWN
jgi:glycosyltransferase involved in cell wall biosynthesis